MKTPGVFGSALFRKGWAEPLCPTEKEQALQGCGKRRHSRIAAVEMCIRDRYTDLSFITTDLGIGSELATVFNNLAIEMCIRDRYKLCGVGAKSRKGRTFVSYIEY